MNRSKSTFRGVIVHSTFLALIVGVSVGGVNAAQEQPPPPDIREMLADSGQTGSAAAARPGSLEALRGFYSRRDFAPLWSRDGAPTRQAIAMMQILRTAQIYGLRPQDYSEGLGDDSSIVTTAGDAARSRLESQFDIALSTAVMQFPTHLHCGRIDPQVAGFNLESSRPPLDLGDLLLKLATTGSADEVIAALERWRWLPEFDSPPIIVNIPQFRLFAFQSTRDRKAEILQMDVIVVTGRSQTQAANSNPALRDSFKNTVHVVGDNSATGTNVVISNAW